MLQRNFRPSEKYNYLPQQNQWFIQRAKRSPFAPLIHMKRPQARRPPPCVNTDGVLGGKNAFHLVTLVVALVTLVVNVTNSLNNNNNNLNSNSLNSAQNSNVDANVNSNSANVVNVMPPGRKRRRRRWDRIYNI